MENFSVHMRVSGVSVTDADVSSRQAAATSLATAWAKEATVSTIVTKAAEVAEALGGDGRPSEGLGGEVQKAIQKKAPSFLYEERPLEVGVCAGMALVSILTGDPGTLGRSIPDFYAATLWLALSYQPSLEAERREKLRCEVLDAASRWTTACAEHARVRSEVPDPAVVKVTLGAENLATSNFKEAVAGTIEALRRNAALDREELDFLWWVQLGRSRHLKRQLSELDETTRIVTAGIEAATMLRRLPCEVHREIVLRTLDQDPELDHSELVIALGENRALLGEGFTSGNVQAHPTVFPLLHSLATGNVKGPGSGVKRRVSEWGERALLEAGFVKLMNGLAKI